MHFNKLNDVYLRRGATARLKQTDSRTRLHAEHKGLISSRTDWIRQDLHSLFFYTAKHHMDSRGSDNEHM